MYYDQKTGLLVCVEVEISEGTACPECEEADLIYVRSSGLCPLCGCLLESGVEGKKPEE